MNQKLRIRGASMILNCNMNEVEDQLKLLDKQNESFSLTIPNDVQISERYERDDLQTIMEQIEFYADQFQEVIDEQEPTKIYVIAHEWKGTDLTIEHYYSADKALKKISDLVSPYTDLEAEENTDLEEYFAEYLDWEARPENESGWYIHLEIINSKEVALINDLTFEDKGNDEHSFDYIDHNGANWEGTIRLSNDRTPDEFEWQECPSNWEYIEPMLKEELSKI